MQSDEDVLRHDQSELDWVIATSPLPMDRHRARTLSLSDDASGSSPELVAKWLTYHGRRERFARRLSRVMEKHKDDPAFIEKCYAAHKQKCLRVLQQKDQALADWIPPANQLRNPN